MTTLPESTPIPKSFPPPVFSLLDPPAYLAQHLVLTPPSRPSSRSPTTFPPPSLTTSSLTHTAGSCVARAGDSVAVTGVRVEILHVRDIPHVDAEQLDALDARDERRVIDQLGLLVPNVEVSTGASEKFLPGSAPGQVAQGAAWRLKDLLVNLGLISLEQLVIRKEAAVSGGDEGEGGDEEEIGASESKREIAGYWVLYIDVTLISHAGSILPVIWASALGALKTTSLPVASFSTLYDTIVCSSKIPPKLLHVRGTPVISTFAVFEATKHKGLSLKFEHNQQKAWILVDPDSIEEEICQEKVLVVIDCSDIKKGAQILRVEKSGGGFIDRHKMINEIFKLAVRRWGEWNAVLDVTDNN